MAYQICILPAALKSLKSLPEPVRKRIQVKIDDLSANPSPRNSKTLKGSEGYRCIRVGNYRVIYRLEKNLPVVLVIRVGHRRDVYR